MDDKTDKSLWVNLMPRAINLPYNRGGDHMFKYILFAISVTVLSIAMTKTIGYFYICIDSYCEYQDNYITGLFEEAGL